jgi:cell division protein FtsB
MKDLAQTASDRLRQKVLNQPTLSSLKKEIKALKARIEALEKRNE